VLCGGLALLAGCVSEPESHVVSAPPPPAPQQTQVVVAQPSQPVVQAVQTPTGAVVVTQAPPALQQEVVTAQPSSAHKWVPGYWTWRTGSSRYEWIAGHWEVPPTRDSVWVAPRWETTSSGAYRFYEGYWN
jgi:hypothetical protein